MDIKKAALAVIDDFCHGVVDHGNHDVLQEACRNVATEEKTVPQRGEKRT